MNQKLFDYIAHSPTAYQAAAHTAALLEQAGYQPLCESEPWSLEAGKGYYVTRNGSSLIAFRLPDREPIGFMIAAAHGDSPCFKIKENAELASGAYVQLSVERYGGMLCASWMDRPLSVAGRVLVRTERGVEARLTDLQEPVALIPNVPIHMNRNANDGMSYNAAVDMLPLWGMEGARGTFRRRIAQAAGVAEEDILATDLYVYNPTPGFRWGDFITAPRLDDLQCAFSALEGFLTAQKGASMPVYCLFDNEEVGCTSKQGAAGTFLPDVLTRVTAACGMTDAAYRAAVANSFMVSCDNAHAQHPNHPELFDKNHAVQMNRGVVVKYNANQKYTSDGVSAAIFGTIARKAGVALQNYANRADLPGGSTLGNIANTQVSLNTVDIGLAQLAMHSALETAGAEDTAAMVKVLAAFFGTTLRMERDGAYTLG